MSWVTVDMDKLDSCDAVDQLSWAKCLFALP